MKNLPQSFCKGKIKPEKFYFLDKTTKKDTFTSLYSFVLMLFIPPNPNYNKGN